MNTQTTYLQILKEPRQFLSNRKFLNRPLNSEFLCNILSQLRVFNSIMR